MTDRVEKTFQDSLQSSFQVCFRFKRIRSVRVSNFRDRHQCSEQYLVVAIIIIITLKREQKKIRTVEDVSNRIEKKVRQKKKSIHSIRTVSGVRAKRPAAFREKTNNKTTNRNSGN